MKTKSLFHRYLNSSNEKLIVIIDQSHLYQPKTVETVRAILEDRNLDTELVKNIARSLMQEQLEHFFGNYNIWNDELKLPKSEFLTEEEVLEIFEIEFDNYQNDRLDFSADLNMYMAA